MWVVWNINMRAWCLNFESYVVVLGIFWYLMFTARQKICSELIGLFTS
ncbi:hypothetical protein LINPERHAP1_LOCUS35712 [Linum perenne]